MNNKRRIFTIVPLVVLLVTLVLAVSPVGAHANLMQSVPEANAMLDRAPVLVELYFSEPLEDGFSTIEVLDVEGERVDNDDATVDASDPLRMTATLRSLPDGIYTVSWRALSSVDSHITAGVFPIAVGEVDAEALAAAQAGTTVNLSPGEALSRWLTYASLMTLVGGTLFILLIWEPATVVARTAKSIKPRWRLIAKVALWTLIGATIFWTFVQAGQATGREIAFPWDPAYIQVIFTTRFGALMLARVVLALLMVRPLLFNPSRRSRWFAFVLGLLALLTISLGSHAAAEPEPFLPILSDWAHLIVASLWIGGLIHFAAVMIASRTLEPPARTRLTAVLIPRFSALALMSIATLVLTGVYASLLHIPSLEALTSTTYGQALLMKLAIFAPMLALGGINLVSTSPNMKEAATTENGKPSLVTRFRRIVSSEATLGIAVLLSVGLLTTIPTPSNLESGAALSGVQEADDLEIELRITPGRVGINTFEVTVRKDGRPLDDARAVELRFTPTTSELPPSDAQLIAQGDGKYAVEGAFFSLPDAYQVQTAVRRNDVADSFANFDFSVGTNVSIAPRFPWHRLTGLLLVLAGLTFFYALYPFLGSGVQRILVGGAPMLFCTAVGFTIIVQDPAPPQQVYQVNPIPPNAESVATGGTLYQQNCLPCHGAGGLGDGPTGLTLNPPPADLTQHTAPGVHPDGRLFNWITNGFEDSVMPAFKERLSDDERWHVVNYIRTLSPDAEPLTR